METCPICRKPRKLTNDETESMRKFLIWKLGEDRVYGAEAETAAQAFLIQTMCSCSRHPLDKLRLLFVSSTGTVLLATIAVWVFFPYAVNRTFILWCTSVAYTAALLALLLILLGDAYAESESGTHVWSISQRAATVSQVWDSNRHRITSSQMKRVWRCISIVSGFIVAITAPFILARAISARVCLGDVTSVSAIIGGCNAIANFLVVVVFFRRIRAGMRRDCERILGRLDKPSEIGRAHV